MLLRFFILCFCFVGVASGARNDLAGNPILSKIEISGLGRTSQSVVFQELRFREGDRISVADYDESIQRLRNLRIFSVVEPHIEMKDDGTVALSIGLEEKWTTVPITKFSSGGGAQHLIVGTYDINVLGKYKEVGGQYENYNGKHSAVLWYRNPRFLKRRLLFGIDGWTVRRPVTLYDTRALVIDDFALDRKKLNLFVEWEYQAWLTVGTGFEFDRDKYSDITSNTNIARLNLTLGRLNYDNYLIKGHYLRLDLEQAIDSGKDTESFSRMLWDGQLYFRTPLYSNIALHMRFGLSNADPIQHQFAVGGLENVRGYFDGQFRGKTFWQLNAEFRLPSYRSRWFVLQHIFFYDATQTSDELNELFDSHYRSSYGSGIRLISPKVYRLTARIDYALTNSATGASAISFGAQQFF